MTPPTCFGDNAFTAHPKWDAASGVLYGWSYRDVQPYVTCIGAPRRTDRNPRYRRRPIRAKRPRHVAYRELRGYSPSSHFWSTRSASSAGCSVFGWDPTLPTKLALVSRADINAPIKWVTADFDNQYIMHTMSANHVGDKLILDGTDLRPPAISV